MNVFLYGTLRYPPLLEVVLGRALRAGEAQPDVLQDARVGLAEDGSFPAIQLGTGGQADGVLLAGLNAEDAARLDFFERGFGYERVTVQTGTGPAEVYLSDHTPGAAFDLDVWAAKWGVYAVELGREVMAHYGQRRPEDMAPLFRGIRLRAWARTNAQRPRAVGFRGQIDMQARSFGYADFYAVEDYALRFEEFDGAMSDLHRRAVWLGMDAALVLPYDPVRDRVLLVEQIRMGPLGRGDPQLWQLEPIAGHVDPGETPEEAARREAREEAGLEVRDLIPIAEGYPSPGASSEFYYIYAALVDLPDDVAGIGGELSEGENIRSRLLSFDALMEMLEDRRASVIPLALAGYWLARHRDRLRAE